MPLYEKSQSLELNDRLFLEKFSPKRGKKLAIPYLLIEKLILDLKVTIRNSLRF